MSFYRNITDDESLAKYVVKRYSDQIAKNGTLFDIWQDITDIVDPKKSSIQETHYLGEDKEDEVFDITAQQALKLYQSGLHDGITPSNTQFFDLRVRDEELNDIPVVKTWLERLEKRVNYYVSDSNFYTKVEDSYGDEALFGTSVVLTEYLEDEDTFRFSVVRPYHCVFAENARGVVDKVIREYKMTSEQIVEEFGERGEDMLSSLQDETEMHSILQASFPNPSYDSTKPNTAKNKAFVSIHCSKNGAKVLRKGGFDTNPFAVTRIHHDEDNPYGYSISRTALPDIRQANQMAYTLIRAFEQYVEPTYMVPDEANLSSFTFGARDVISYNSTALGGTFPIGVVPNGAAPEQGYVQLQEKQQNIRKAFYTDLFVTIEQLDPNVSATAVIQAKQERLKLLRSVLTSNRDAKIKPIIERIVSHILLYDNFPEAPEELDEYIERRGGVDVIASSPLFRLQEGSQDIEALNVQLGLAGAIAQFDPSIIDNYNFDFAVRNINDAYDGTTKIFRDEKQVAQIREARQQAQQQQQELEMQAAQAGIAQGTEKANQGAE